MHLVLPDRPLFSRDKTDATGLDRAQGARRARARQQVRAIRHLVATAVNGLKPERVSVVDETGKLLGRRRRRRQFALRRQCRRAQSRVREPAAQASRDHRHLGGRPRPRARADHRRFRRQPHQHQPPTNSIPTAAWCARARRREESSATDSKTAAARSRSATNCRAPRRHRQRRRPPRATRTARPRKSSITRFRAPPRPR